VESAIRTLESGVQKDCRMKKFVMTLIVLALEFVSVSQAFPQTLRLLSLSLVCPSSPW
jgi:hypothetical protein